MFCIDPGQEISVAVWLKSSVTLWQDSERAWNRTRIQIFSVFEITCSEHQKTSLRFQKDDEWFKSLTWKKAIKRLWKISWIFSHPFEFVPQMSKGTVPFSPGIIAVCLLLFFGHLFFSQSSYSDTVCSSWWGLIRWPFVGMFSRKLSSAVHKQHLLYILIG